MALPEGSSGPAVDRRVVRTHADVLRAALDVLLDEGVHAVTHQHVADVAGYSKATVYAHWKSRHDLLLASFSRLAHAPHHTVTGDLRADLIAELTAFRTALAEHRLDRALPALVELTAFVPGMTEVRDVIVTEGERVLRSLVEPLFDGPEREAAVLMLSGAVLQSALLHGRLPDDETIVASVDLTLRAVTGR